MNLQWQKLETTRARWRVGDRNRIVDDSDSIIGFGPIPNPTTKSSRRSRFWYKIDLVWSKFNPFWLKDQFKDQKVWLKDQKSQLKYCNNRLKVNFYQKQWPKQRNTFVFIHFRSNSTNFCYKLNYFWYKWFGFESNLCDE